MPAVVGSLCGRIFGCLADDDIKETSSLLGELRGTATFSKEGPFMWMADLVEFAESASPTERIQLINYDRLGVRIVSNARPLKAINPNKITTNLS